MRIYYALDTKDMAMNSDIFWKNMALHNFGITNFPQFLYIINQKMKDMLRVIILSTEVDI